MKFKGNYYWFFAAQLISGLIAYPLMMKFGVVKGMLFSFIPFLIGMITTLKNYKPDERELQLVHRTDSIKSIFLIVAMAIIYLHFPAINWFFAMVAGIGFFRGMTGLFIFATN